MDSVNQPQLPQQPSTEEVKARRRPLFRLLQLLSLGLVAGLLALLIWRVAVTGGGSKLVGEIAAGKRPLAPGFNLPVIWTHDETWPRDLRRALNDGHVRLSELRGRPVVINFWASWCVPCKAEAPRLVAAARKHTGQVAFLGIDIQDFTSDAHGFLHRYHTNYVSVRNGDGGIADRYGFTGIPETYFVGARGRVVVHIIGQVSDASLVGGIKVAAASK